MAVKPKHIFLVDDNEIYAMMLDYILSKDTVYKFVSFNSGEECIKNLYLDPQIIILDYGMKGMNGYETLLEIKKQKPSIHVIILTSHEESNLKKQLLNAGADDVVFKQGHGERKLIEKIDETLNKINNETKEITHQENGTKEALFFVAFLLLILLGLYFYK